MMVLKYHVQKLMHVAIYETRTILKMCKHESDYAIPYNYVKMKRLLCHSCWNE